MDLRLLRVTRFYRAYPQFKRYSDHECEELAIRARSERGDAGWMIPAAGGLLLAFVACGMLYMLSLLTLTAAGAGGGAGKVPTAGSTAAANLKPLETVLFLGVAAGSVAVFFVAAILIHRLMVVRTMLRLIQRGNCPYCDFSLVGLIIDREGGGSVRCPECGRKVVLSQHRIREEDLIPDSPEGLKAMREQWKKLGADKYGALSGGKLEGGRVAEPKGKDREKWAKVDLKQSLAASRQRARSGVELPPLPGAGSRNNPSPPTAQKSGPERPNDSSGSPSARGESQ